MTADEKEAWAAYRAASKAYNYERDTERRAQALLDMQAAWRDYREARQ